MINFLRTLGGSEVRLGYLNLTDNARNHYGRHFFENKTRFIVIDQDGRRAFTQKLKGNQLWGTLKDWYQDNNAVEGDTVILSFNPEERIDNLHVIHLGLFDSEGGRRQEKELNKETLNINKSMSNEPFLTPKAIDISEPELPGRHSVQTYRILRDTAIARWLKQLYAYECQVCGMTIELQNGGRYAEVHHIKPLGTPHNGLDIPHNMLVLCPNHHAMCDLGVMSLSKKNLTVLSGHQLSDESLQYHNSRIAGEDAQQAPRPAQ